MVLLALPMAMKRAAWGAEWTFAGKGFALAGGAFVVADYIATRFNQPRSAWVLPLGTTCLGGFLILGGIQHFIWPKFVAQLVPAWIPGATFWTYFSAGALIAGGIGILIPRTARSAATLVALMIFSWVVILHIPRAWTTSPSLNEWLAAFEALAMSGTAWLIAGANRRTIGD
ncbi:hypothetical protein [Oleiharenicola lentus]|uniref:hypothetical protein n=1 Tax=Oleiharenicola lentus TaxID=2508720 RepID=UPI003F6685C4